MSNRVNIFIEQLYPSVPKNYTADTQRISVDVENLTSLRHYPKIMLWHNILQTLIQRRDK